MKAIRIIAVVAVIAISFSSGAAQQEKIPKNPFRFSDAVTGKPIREVLVLPRYGSAKGIFIAPEGPAKAIYRNYLDKPFLYRTGTPFILKRPRWCALPLLPVVIGKLTDLEGVLIVAPKYRPIWFDNLWQTRDILNTRDIRDLQLTPIPDDEWSLILDQKLTPLIDKSFISTGDFDFWGLYDTEHGLRIDYNKREREVVRKFLQSTTRSHTK